MAKHVCFDSQAPTGMAFSTTLKLPTLLSTTMSTRSSLFPSLSAAGVNTLRTLVNLARTCDNLPTGPLYLNGVWPLTTVPSGSTDATRVPGTMALLRVPTGKESVANGTLVAVTTSPSTCQYILPERYTHLTNRFLTYTASTRLSSVTTTTPKFKLGRTMVKAGSFGLGRTRMLPNGLTSAVWPVDGFLETLPSTGTTSALESGLSWLESLLFPYMVITVTPLFFTPDIL